MSGEMEVYEADVEKGAIDELNELIEGLGGQDNIKIGVYRVSEEYHGEWERLGEYADAGLFNLDDIHRRFGGGKYRVKITKNGRIAANKQILLAKEKLNGNGVEKSGDSDLKMFAERLDIMATKVAQAQAPQPAQNPMAMMEQMVTMMSLMKQLMPEPQPQQSPLEVLQLAKELAEVMGGNGGGDTGSVLGVASEFLKNFGPQLSSALQNPYQAPRQVRQNDPRLIAQAKQQMRPQPSQPAQQPQRSQNAANKIIFKPVVNKAVNIKPQSKEDEMRKLLAKMDILKEYAESGKSVEETAERIRSEVPGFLIGAFFGYSEWEKTLIAKEPILANHHDFLIAVKNELTK